MAEPPESRLDREIDEILEKKAKEPVDFRSYARVHQPQSPRSSVQSQAEIIWRWLSAIPLALAFALVIAALLIRDISPLLALVLNTGAVVAIWLPAIRGLNRPSSPVQTDVKYWRGRPYVSDIKSTISRSPVDSLKRYFDRRR